MFPCQSGVSRKGQAGSHRAQFPKQLPRTFLGTKWAQQTPDKSLPCARLEGVCPHPSCRSTLAPFSSRNCTSLFAPAKPAACSGFRPVALASLISAPIFCRLQCIHILKIDLSRQRSQAGIRTRRSRALEFVENIAVRC